MSSVGWLRSCYFSHPNGGFRTSDLSYHKLPVLCLFVVSTGGARVDFSFRRTLNVVSERMP
jgi:hypothetical protein